MQPCYLRAKVAKRAKLYILFANKHVQPITCIYRSHVNKNIHTAPRNVPCNRISQL